MVGTEALISTQTVGTAAGGTHPLRALRFAREDKLFRRTLVSWIHGERRDLTDERLAWFFVRFPMMTLGVIARIHWQALKLFIKRVPFFSKPLPPPNPLSR